MYNEQGPRIPCLDELPPKPFLGNLSSLRLFRSALTSENDHFPRKEEMVGHTLMSGKELGADSCLSESWKWHLLWKRTPISVNSTHRWSETLRPSFWPLEDSPLPHLGRGEAGIWHRGFSCHESGRETACISRRKWNFGVHKGKYWMWDAAN